MLLPLHTTTTTTASRWTTWRHLDVAYHTTYLLPGTSVISRRRIGHSTKRSHSFPFVSLVTIIVIVVGFIIVDFFLVGLFNNFFLWLLGFWGLLCTSTFDFLRSSGFSGSGCRRCRRIRMTQNVLHHYVDLSVFIGQSFFTHEDIEWYSNVVLPIVRLFVRWFLVLLRQFRQLFLDQIVLPFLLRLDLEEFLRMGYVFLWRRPTSQTRYSKKSLITCLDFYIITWMDPSSDFGTKKPHKISLFKELVLKKLQALFKTGCL